VDKQRIVIIQRLSPPEVDLNFFRGLISSPSSVRSQWERKEENESFNSSIDFFIKVTVAVNSTSTAQIFAAWTEEITGSGDVEPSKCMSLLVPIAALPRGGKSGIADAGNVSSGKADATSRVSGITNGAEGTKKIKRQLRVSDGDIER